MINYDNLVAFYNYYTDLNYVDRRGWVIRDIPSSIIEKVMQHTCQMAMMGSVLSKELKLDINFIRFFDMILIHDIGEALIGDIAEKEIDKREDKYIKERKAVLKILSCLSKEVGDYYIFLWDEFESRITEEAKFAYQLDKLDAILRAKKYDKELSRDDLFNDFYQYEEDRGTFEDSDLEELFKSLKIKND